VCDSWQWCGGKCNAGGELGKLIRPKRQHCRAWTLTGELAAACGSWQWCGGRCSAGVELGMLTGRERQHCRAWTWTGELAVACGMPAVAGVFWLLVLLAAHRFLVASNCCSTGCDVDTETQQPCKVDLDW
jgi:hypothetical protein